MRLPGFLEGRRHRAKQDFHLLSVSGKNSAQGVAGRCGVALRHCRARSALAELTGGYPYAHA